LKIKTARNNLLNPIAAVIGAIQQKQTLPTLTGVLIQARSDGTVFTGTDLEIQLTAKTDLIPEAEGGWSIPAKRLHDILRVLPDDADVTLAVEKDGKTTLRSGRSRFVLKALPECDYPNLLDIPYGGTISIAQGNLKKAITATAYAMAVQDARYYLNGLSLECSSTKLTVCATDGHRLAVTSIKNAEIQVDEDQSMILPNKSIGALMKLLDEDSEEQVTVLLGKNHVRVNSGSLFLVAKLINGEFPNYKRVIPREPPSNVLVSREELLGLLRRVSLLLNAKSNNGLEITFNSGSLSARATNTDNEEANDEISVEYNNGLFVSGYNYRYLQDAVQAIDGKSLKWSFSGPLNSILIEDADTPDAGLHVIMPMRL